MTKWTHSEIPSQSGRTAVVTGTGGIGLEAALALARAGAKVIVAGRNPVKGEEALAAVRSQVANANVHFERVDLANLGSVASLADRLGRSHDKLDILINNAGVMVPPKREQSKDGYELQFATNYLGHFALTAHLLPLLHKGSDPRVISLSSVAARNGAIDFEDMQSVKRYVPMQAYGQSKLACLMFAFEFQRRSQAQNWGVSGIAAHPGISRTNLLHNGPGRMSLSGLTRSALWFLFQPASQGALPTLFAATAPDASPGAYYGPDSLGETRGHPAPARIPPQALDREVAARLWAESTALAGVDWPSA